MRALRLTAGLCAAAVCAVAAVQAALAGAADALGKLAHQELGAVVARPEAGMEAYAGATALAERALRVDAHNPHLLELAARVRIASVAHENAHAIWTRAALTQAAMELRRAQWLRPPWPYGPALLAAVKYRLAEEDAELRRALVFAVRQGGAEREVAAHVAEVGLRAWDALDAPARAATGAALARLAQTDPRAADVLLRTTGRVAQGCLALGAAIAEVPVCAGEPAAQSDLSPGAA